MPASCRGKTSPGEAPKTTEIDARLELIARMFRAIGEFYLAAAAHDYFRPSSL
jgi:hypothetical protein